MRGGGPAGGAVLREKWGTRRTIDYKGGIDLVTDADRASEEALLEFLVGRFPGSAVLAEESGARAAGRARPATGCAGSSTRSTGPPTTRTGCPTSP